VTIFSVRFLPIMVILSAAAGASAAQLASQPATTAPSAELPTPSTGETHYSRSADDEIRFQEGLSRYTRGDLVGAESDFKALVADDPGDSESYYYLGLSQLDQNEPALAVANFDQSLHLDSSRDEVRAARATANIRLHRLDAAKVDLDALDKLPRFRSLDEYLHGQLLYAQGDLEGASKAFAAAKAEGGTEAAPAGFYEGLTYLRMRQLVKARITFQDSMLAPDRDPTLASASRQLDAVLAQQQSKAPKPYEGQISLGYEYDTNVIQLGADIPTPAGISNKSDGREVLLPRGSYSFLQTDRLEAGLEGTGYFTWQDSLSSFDIDSYQAGPFANYKLANNLYVSGRYGFNYVQFGYQPFLIRNIVTPQVTYLEPKFGYTSVFYQFQDRQFKQPSLTDALDRSGTDQAVGIVQGLNLPTLFPGAGAANLELNYRFEDQQARGSDFAGNFNAVGATLYTPLPFLKLRADAGVTLDYEQYNHQNSLDVDGRDRRDFEVDVATGLTKDLTKDLALRLDYTFTNRNSNVTSSSGNHPYAYDRHVVGIRLIYSF
jgi:Tfp pilus assembly protein PilF